jgi:rare lipoprotein A
MGIYRLALSVILGGSCFFLFAESNETTTASYYGEKYRGKPTASGELFNPDKLTAAMWDVPFGSLIEVHYHDKVVVVRINDRGPAKRLKRGIDLSKAAFKALAPLELGLIKVKLIKRKGI